MKIADHEVLHIFSFPTQMMIDESREILQKMNIHHKWTYTKGKGVKIAVIDTGVDVHHPSLVHAASKSFNSFNGTNLANDVEGHGTHVAGVIFGKGKVYGVAPEAEMYAVKALGDDGSGSNESVARAIDWSVANDADIISMSLGSNFPSTEVEQALDRAVSKNIACVCAAGNDANGNQNLISIDYPAKYESTIAVGAIDTNKNIASFSSAGNVDVVSYGVDILSAYPNNRYAVLSGTSMATPYISGCIALMQSNALIRLGRKLTLAELRMLLILNASDLGAEGKDQVYGYGKFKF